MWSFLEPPPKTFPLSTIYVSKAFRHLFHPITHGAAMCTWVYATRCLDMGLTPDPGVVGTYAHIWTGAPWGGQDSWGLVDAIGAPCDPTHLHIPSITMVGSANYNATLSKEPPYTIQQIWDRIRAAIGPTAPGAIRWGDLWLKVITPNLTHSIDVMHFDGPP